MTSGAIAKYPLTRRKSYRTSVLTSVDMSEQRFSKGSVLAAFDLLFTSVSTADKNTVRDFFDARQGTFDTTWDITFDDPPGTPVTYLHLQFMPGQNFEATEVKTGRWNFNLKVRQGARH